MGPLVTRGQQAAALDGIRRLATEAAIVCGGAEPPELAGIDRDKSAFVAPTLLKLNDASKAQAVHEVEVFGPAATVVPYRDEQEAVQLIARGGGWLRSRGTRRRRRGRLRRKRWGRLRHGRWDRRRRGRGQRLLGREKGESLQDRADRAFDGRAPGRLARRTPCAFGVARGALGQCQCDEPVAQRPPIRLRSQESDQLLLSDHVAREARGNLTELLDGLAVKPVLLEDLGLGQVTADELQVRGPERNGRDFQLGDGGGLPLRCRRLGGRRGRPAEGRCGGRGRAEASRVEQLERLELEATWLSHPWPGTRVRGARRHGQRSRGFSAPRLDELLERAGRRPRCARCARGGVERSN